MKRSITRFTVLVLDDDEGVRDTVEAILKHDYQILKAKSGEEALEIIKKRTVHLALIDIRLPGISGVDVLEVIKETHPTTCCIMISALKEVPIVVDCMRKGALDYIEKDFDYDTLRRRVEIALRLYSIEKDLLHKDYEIKQLKDELSVFYSKRRKRRLKVIKNGSLKMEPDYQSFRKAFHEIQGEPKRVLLEKDNLPELTQRELEILKLLDEDPSITNRDIADKLGITLSTVKTHLNNIFAKLDITCRCQAILSAKERRLL